MEKVVVSVIIPSFNGEKFIEKAINSVLIQQVPLELIIIDDASCDHTRAIIEKYLSDSRVRYFRNDFNMGVAESRNRGVSLSRGEYIAFLDSDDWWDDSKLKKQLSLIEREGKVICSTARELVDIEGNSIGKIIPVKPEISYKMLLNHNSINCSSVLIKKRVAEEFPMKHEDVHEDYFTWLRVLQKYDSACAINEPLLKYRVSDAGKSGSKLKSAKMTFKVYRYLGFGWFKSLWCFCKYAINGLWKYR